MFQDAIALEDIALEKVVDEMDWPLLASDDLMQSQAARPKIDWNSKRADDDDIETTIQLKFMNMSVDADVYKNQPFETTVTEHHQTMSEDEGHGYTSEGSSAACALNASHGVINCIRCIETGFSVLASGLDELDRKLSQRILEHVRASKGTGVSKAMCLVSLHLSCSTNTSTFYRPNSGKSSVSLSSSRR
ncbi:hypothetical protein F5I97DRAFT_1606122 [Phlebopus sp. FC_14]|nr:hypothetical protein F5I97DRAFT_1606122 [Phlebopus sp. FC_14]